MWWDLGEIASFGLIGLAVLPGHRTAALLGVKPVLPGQRALASLGAALTLAFALLMTAYVFGLDTYTNKASRWANRGAEAHTLYLATMGAAGVFIAVFLLLVARGTRGWVGRPALLLSGVGNVVLGFLLVLLFDNN